MIINKLLITKNAKFNKTQIIPIQAKAEPNKLRNSNPEYDFFFKENPIIKLSKRQKNFTIIPKLKIDDTIVQPKEESIPELMINHEILLEKRQNHYIKKRKNLFIKEKLNSTKFAKSPKTLESQNNETKKYILIKRLVESEIEFSKKEINIEKKLDKKLTKADKFCKDLINNKLVTRNFSDCSESMKYNINDYDRNSILKKKLYRFAQAIYEAITTNNPLIISNIKMILNEEEQNLIISLDKVYKHCYSIGEKVNLDYVKYMLFKEFNLFYSTSSGTKICIPSSNYSKTITPLFSFNDRYTYNTNKPDFSTITKFFSGNKIYQMKLGSNSMDHDQKINEDSNNNRLSLFDEVKSNKNKTYYSNFPLIKKLNYSPNEEVNPNQNINAVNQNVKEIAHESFSITSTNSFLYRLLK